MIRIYSTKSNVFRRHINHLFQVNWRMANESISKHRQSIQQNVEKHKNKTFTAFVQMFVYRFSYIYIIISVYQFIFVLSNNVTHSNLFVFVCCPNTLEILDFVYLSKNKLQMIPLKTKSFVQ